MKKILSWLLTLSMLLSLCVMSVSADTEPWSLKAGEVKDGKVTVSLVANVDGAINALEGAWSETDTEESGITYTSKTKPVAGSDYEKGKEVKLMAVPEESITAGTTLMTATYTVADTVKPGDYEITFAMTGVLGTGVKMGEGTLKATVSIPYPDYSITVADGIENGSVESNKDTVNGAAVAGTDAAAKTVTLTVTPDAGYELDTLTVKGKTENLSLDKQNITAGENNTYTFTMPAENVTVTATFKKLAYTVNFETPENAESIKVTVGGKTIETGGTVEWGETVSVTVTPENDKTDADGKLIRYKVTSVTAGNETVTKKSDGNYTFTMPKEAVEISATIVGSRGNTVTGVVIPDGGGSFGIENPASTGENDKYVRELTVAEDTEDRTVTFVVTGIDLKTYKIESVEVKGETAAYSLGNGVTQKETLDNGGKYAFKMPKEDVKVTVTVAEIEAAKSYALKFSDATVTVGGESVETDKEVKTGATVTVTPAAAGADKQIGSVEYTYVNDSNVSITNVIELNSKGVGTFEMPAANTTITVNYEAKTYTAKFYENGKAKAAEYENLAITFKHSDETITLPAAPTTDDDAIFKGWVDKADKTETKLAAGSKFTVGSADVSFYAYWQPADDIAGTVNDIIDGLGSSDINVSADADRGETGVDVSQSIAKDDVKKVEDSAKSLSFDKDDVNNFNTPTVKKDAAVEALVKSGVITYEDNKTMAGNSEIKKIEVQTEVYLDVEVNNYTTEEDGSRSLEADITAMAKTSVIAKDGEEKEQGKVTISDKETKLNKKTQLSMELPENFFATGGDLANLTITHNPDSDDAKKIAVDKITYKANKNETEETVNVKTWKYKAGIYTVYFTVDSLSPFLFTTTVGAKIGDEVYATAQAAINAAENGDKVDVMIAPQDGKLYIPTGLVVRIANKTNEDIKLAPKSDRASVYPTLVQAGETEDVRATANYGFDFADWFLIGRGGTGKGLITVYVNEKDGAVVTVGTNSVTIVPNTGYKISKITVNGGEVAIPANGVLGGLNAFDVVAITLVKTGASTGFVDVPAGMWYEGAVAWAVSKGITTGKGSVTTFAPMDTCTRAEAVTFLYRAAGSPAVATTAQFKDVAADAWYAKAVAWAVANGITKGTGDGTTFSPDETCSRAEIVTFLARLAGNNTTAAPTQFKDVAATDWFAGSVAWAVNNGVTTGTGDGTTFSPNTTCTRAEIVTFLYRDFVKIA